VRDSEKSRVICSLGHRKRTVQAAGHTRQLHVAFMLSESVRVSDLSRRRRLESGETVPGIACLKARKKQKNDTANHKCNVPLAGW
jgi:hypothetical protein